jgi:hypothetical protein
VLPEDGRITGRNMLVNILQTKIYQKIKAHFSWLQTFAVFCMLHSFFFGQFPGIWILCADVSEHPVCSISISCLSKKSSKNMDDKASRNVGTQNSDAGESPKKRKITINCVCCLFIRFTNLIIARNLEQNTTIVYMISFQPSLTLVWFEASAAKQMRTALFRATTQRVVVIFCRRFGTAYQFHISSSRNPWIWEL